MSQSASRIIGIIRIADPSEFGVDLSVAADDSTLGSWLAGLVGKQTTDVELGSQHGRWQSRTSSLSRTARRSVLRANIARLHEDLAREFLEMAAH